MALTKTRPGVSGGHFQTLSDLQAADISTYRNGDAVYLTGRASAGDGGEGWYHLDTSNLSTEVGEDEVTSTEGDGTFYIAPASDKTGASGAWVSEAADRQGLIVKISDYLPTNSAFSDYTARLQLAVDDWLEGDGYFLDLEGRVISISSTITLDEDKVGSAFSSPKVMVNGTIDVRNDWSDLSSDPAIKMFSTAGTNRIERMTLSQVILKCNTNSAGVLIDGNQLQCAVLGCEIKEPTDYGVKHINPGTTGGGIEVRRTTIAKNQSATAYASRTGIGIDITEDGTDAKISDNLIIYMKEGINFSGSNLLITGNHIYQGIPDDTVVDQLHDPAIRGPERLNSVISNNYIDGGTLVLDEALVSGTNTFQGYAQITNNTFLLNYADSTAYFIALMPSTTNAVLINFICTGNTFSNFSGANSTDVIQEPFKVDTTNGGSLDIDGASQEVEIHSNYFRSDVVPQAAQPQVRINFDGSTSYAIDLTGSTSFGLAACNYVRSIGVQTAGTNPNEVFFDRTDNFTGDLILETAISSGGAMVTFDCNQTTQFS